MRWGIYDLKAIRGSEDMLVRVARLPRHRPVSAADAGTMRVERESEERRCLLITIPYFTTESSGLDLMTDVDLVDGGWLDHPMRTFDVLGEVVAGAR